MLCRTVNTAEIQVDPATAVKNSNLLGMRCEVLLAVCIFWVTCSLQSVGICQNMYQKTTVIDNVMSQTRHVSKADKLYKV